MMVKQLGEPHYAENIEKASIGQKELWKKAIKDIRQSPKYNGLELYITADDIIPAGDGFIYTVQLVNNNSAAVLDNKYLASGTKFFRKGSARGEYGERFSDIQTGTGFREFYNIVGGAEAHVHYSISSRADLMLKGGMNADGSIPVTEIWRTFDQDVDPSVSSTV